MSVNLNDLDIIDWYDGACLQSTEVSARRDGAADGGVSVFFDDHATRIIAEIQRADMVVGCVAWLTHEGILEALGRSRCGVSLLVQKEDWLRPDATSKARLRELYDAIDPSRNPDRLQLGDLASQLSMCGDPSVAPIRCVGVCQRDRRHPVPRMHHKFAVFCRTETRFADGWHAGEHLTPYTAVTGSFNWTQTAVLSAENTVWIASRKIAASFFDEWQRMLAASEPLDWQHEWCEPEWRIGT